jgi:hypothetical protein
MPLVSRMGREVRIHHERAGGFVYVGARKA